MPNIITNLHVSKLFKRPQAADVSYENSTVFSKGRVGFGGTPKS
jgi:hypothetical protein